MPDNRLQHQNSVAGVSEAEHGQQCQMRTSDLTDTKQILVPHPPPAVASIQQCVTAIEQWMAASRLRLNMIKTELIWTGTTCLRSRAAVLLWHLVLLTLPNQMMSVFSESNSRRICHSTRMSLSTLLVLSAFFKYNNYDASNMTTLLLHSFMHSSQDESIIPAVS